MATGYAPPAASTGPGSAQYPMGASIPGTMQPDQYYSGSSLPPGLDPSAFGYGTGPMPTFGGGNAGNTAPPTPFQLAYGAGLAYNSPALAQIQNGIGQDALNVGWNDQMFGYNQQGLQLQGKMQIGDLNTEIATNSLQRQRALMDAAAYGRMMGYNTDAFNAQNQSIVQNAVHQLGGINSQATANGAFTAPGTGTDRNYNYANMITNQQQAKAQYQQQQESLGMSQGNKDVQAQILDTISGNLGMKASDTQALIQNGLDKLNLSHTISVNDLMTAAANGNLQAAQLLNQIAQGAGAFAAGMGQH